MKWKKIKISEVPEDDEFLFLTGDNEIHLGILLNEIQSMKKAFYCCIRHERYRHDKKEEYDERVLYWCPIPKSPLEKDNEK